MSFDLGPRASLVASVATKLCTLWEVFRRDGVSLRFTDHDRVIVFRGRAYEPDKATQASASSRSEGLKPGDRQLDGVVGEETITLNDLQAGALRGASVLETVIDWRAPWAGAVLERAYVVVAARFTDTSWEADMRSASARLQRVAGNVFGRTCRFTVGDAGCGVNLGLFESPLQQVVSVSFPDNTRTSFSISSAAYVVGFPAGFADFGLARWFTGRNAGHVSEVQKEERPSPPAVAFTLLEPAPYDIDAGDKFRIVAGCDRTLATCRDKFDNLLRFGGFPFMPGIDKIAQQAKLEV